MSHYTQFFFLKAYLNLFHSCIGIRLKYYLSFYCFRVISFIISFYILPHYCCGFSQSLLVQRMGETLKSGNEIRILKKKRVFVITWDTILWSVCLFFLLILCLCVQGSYYTDSTWLHSATAKPNIKETKHLLKLFVSDM